MFQPETEDLLPRCAPKPSVADVNAAIVRPSVPEVSIVFTQPESAQVSSTPPQTTYAAWRKQCLPQVIYPPTAEVSNAEYSAMTTGTRSHVYPMRTGAAVVPIINASAAQFSSTRSEPSTAVRTNVTVAVQPSCSMEQQMAYCNPNYTVPSKINENNTQLRKSLDNVHLTRHSIDTNILTICAGTQTDPFPENKDLGISNLATKEDVDSIKTLLVEMRAEQLRLMELVQNLLVSEEKTKNEEVVVKITDVATQCERQISIGPLPQKRPHIRYDSIEEEDSTEQDDSHRFRKKTSIIKAPPHIQQFEKQAFRAGTWKIRSEVIPGLANPTVEQTLVMNELAMKYLPNEKLSDLLQELHVSGTPQGQTVQTAHESPLKNIVNYGKCANDLSTASYKYLKKYRLLPEENNNLSPPANGRRPNSPNQQENMLDLDTIRRQPKFM